MSADISTAASIFKTNSQLFEKATQGVPAEQWLTWPGEDSNHLLWIAGHVVVHRGFVLKVLGSEWTSPWRALFVRGTKLSATDQYPNPEEIQRTWGEVTRSLTDALATASPEILGKPSLPKTPSFDGTIGGTVAFLSFHESYHLGQMGYLRKWLGHGQVAG